MENVSLTGYPLKVDTFYFHAIPKTGSNSITRRITEYKRERGSIHMQTEEEKRVLLPAP
jgi:hypothetical protein